MSRRTSRLHDEKGLTLAELTVTLALFGMIMLGVVGTWSKAQEAYFVGAEITEIQQNIRAAMDFMVREIRAAGRDLTDCAFDYQTSATFTAADCTAAKAAACQTTLGGSYTAGGCNNIFAVPIANATATSIQVLADRNDNGTIFGTTNSSPGDTESENVLYQYVAPGSCPGTTTACITRTAGGTPQTMVSVDINAFQIVYYPRPGFPPCNGTPTQNPCPPFAGNVPADQSDADNIGRLQITVTATQTTAGSTINRTLVTDVYMRNRN